MKTLRMPQKHLCCCQLWKYALRYLIFYLVNKKSKTKTQIKHKSDNESMSFLILSYTMVFSKSITSLRKKTAQSKDAALHLCRSYLHQAFRGGTHWIQQKQQLVLSSSFVKSRRLQHCKCQKEPDPPSHLITPNHLSLKTLLHLWSIV